MSEVKLNSTKLFDVVPVGNRYRVNIRKSPGGSFPQELRDYVDMGGLFDKVTIFSDDFGDYSYLSEIDDLLWSLSLASKSVDWDVVFSLSKLKSLSINSGCNALPKEIDIQESLKVLYLDWVKGSDRLIGCLDGVKVLSLNNYAMSDIKGIRANNLEFLDISNSRLISSLCGIESLSFLESLSLENNPKLSNLYGLNYCQRLSFVKIVKNKILRDVSNIGKLNKLRELVLVGEIDSLGWIKNNAHLTHLNFDCNVLSGDELDILYEIDSLQYVRIRDRRGQSVKNKDVQSYLSDKGCDLEQLKLGSVDRDASDFSRRYLL